MHISRVRQRRASTDSRWLWVSDRSKCVHEIGAPPPTRVVLPPPMHIPKYGICELFSLGGGALAILCSRCALAALSSRRL